MDRTTELLVRLVSSQPHQRPDDVIESIIPWLQKTSAFLRDVEPSVIKQLLQGCGYKRGEPDEVLMRQGDVGDCMYIVLSGKVGIYIDGSQSGEDLETGRGPLPTDLSDVTTVNERKASTSSESSRRMATVALAIHAAAAFTRSTKKGTAHPGHVTTADGHVITAEAEEPPRKPGEDSRSEGSTSTVKDVNNNVQEAKAELDRTPFGRFVVNFGAGKCVGELAMMNEDSLRNATVICDEYVDFVVIGRQLYVDTIKAIQERDFAERRRFVVSHPLFKAWNSKLRQLLQMSLIREAFEFDQPIVKQGQRYDGLIFLRSGQAMVTVEPNKHATQYPTFMADPLPPVIVHSKPNPKHSSRRPKPGHRGTVAATELLLPTEGTNTVPSGSGRPYSKRTSSASSALSTPTPAPRSRAVDGRRTVGQQGGSMAEAIAVKRREGYAAAERRMRGRAVRVCTVEAGEMIGDVETVFRLDSYSETAVCTRPVQAYVLTKQNLERLLSKRNTQTIDSLRSTVEWKLTRRLGAGGTNGRHTAYELPVPGVAGVPGVGGPTSSLASFYSVSALLDDRLPVPLVGRLLYRLRRPPEPPDEVSSSMIGSKSLPDRETQFRHLMRAYLDDQTTSLVEPCVPGSVFYRQLAAEKANKRLRQKQKSALRVNGLELMTEGKRRRRFKSVIENRKPRTAVELKRLLSRAEHDLEVVDQLETSRHLQAIEKDKAQLLFNKLIEQFYLEEPVLAGDAITMLHQMILDRLEVSLDVENVLETSRTDDSENLRQEHGEVFSTKASLELEVDLSLQASTNKSTLRKVYLSPRKKIAIDADTAAAAETAVAQGHALTADLPGDAAAAADSHLERVDGVDETINALRSDVHKDAVTFDPQLERSKTFLTEVCDSQSEPGNNPDDLEVAHSTIINTKKSLRSIRSAHGALDRRSRAALMTSLPTYETDTNTGAKDGMNGTNGNRERKLSLLHQLDEAARHRRELRCVDYLINKLLHACFKGMPENPTYRDWETSDRSLRFLEQRVANFVRQSGGGCTALSEYGKQTTTGTSGQAMTSTTPVNGAPSNVVLPKLKRYESTEEEPKFPKPGGRVVIKKQECAVRHRNMAVTDHEHLRVHLVHELPDYQRLRNTKLVMYHLVDDAREQWIQSQR